MAGWIPALIFPIATLVQLFSILQKRSTQNVSTLTWILFGIANLGLYVYTEKYLHIQSVVGFLGTATVDFCIAWLTGSRYFEKKNTRYETEHQK